VTVFVAVEHWTTECVGLHATNKATRFEALEPLRQAVRDHCAADFAPTWRRASATGTTMAAST
jgi:hypothetical protein